ncbi:type II toxin-antitoxin system VapC family toxin [Dankookia rubra]|uniref:type II toxin-antitoxin system VapC family toxin n=1 Tax=Dankookia rubra TaxID=1442381 RepID=UPI00140B09CB|nr:type II toxin-antitoxin system VapC family toxin [Dankookia rubra]
MRLLLDTHAFLFFAFGNRRPTRTAVTAIEGAEEVLLSAAPGYEMALKHAAGKLPEAG